ncbi:hypothetical protein [Tuwongella immobilis]|uniref:Uncharacterized protein n=1 Tax=Tuwongella immobilis TaxID=692036 RepID=A0A6C2YSF9_9BACT|nr:hypothetical protein [Tuwongella immobilis]VIP04073.1 Uncharacterized protein OS=Planctomyces limnophilus (strain ATCC 43296 / DSM 3776 / IFAM 1008 / 290) GN=Plim_2225 PE=4 SV=1 [Tuwongella immobilis]VTS05513.1 Uncharacterized protein OS=Planctomyces limnophilus (strain ATCC 43296 / DSM 3776 / IFAM 1008 / 290) GN=Plim_2225 PE=4 SV=1 [Tuwongella immobilis]
MRLVFRCLGVLTVLTLSGCFFGSKDSSSGWLRRFRPAPAPASATENVVFVDVAQLERAWGDPIMDGPVWSGIDEQVLPSERKALMEENGLRVGLVTGLVPPELQQMLTSERFSINPRRMHLRMGNTGQITLGDPRPTASMKVLLHLDQEPKVRTFQSAQIGLKIQPSVQSDGRIRLKLIPQVQHGEKAHWASVNVAGNHSWTLANDRPTELFEDLAIEATVGANEYLVIGTRRQRQDTFGFYGFAEPKREKPIQRLLVLRVGQTQPEAAELSKIAAPDRTIIAQPLASQASHSSYRGQKP